MQRTFANTGLINIDDDSIKITKNTVMYETFYNCTSLKSFKMKQNFVFYDTFTNCTNLETVEINFNGTFKSINNYSRFVGCTNLTNLKLTWIWFPFQIGSSGSYGDKLTLESLLYCCWQCQSRKPTEAFNILTVGTTNLEKLADIYVRLTGEPEPSGGTFYAFEQCLSTDEGAMTINEYMALKRWQLA